ncbi:hypothetical protein GE09DRAFT_263138 [Coniochaeta sp. 2T2.1]|nr:hypothetical protein GE09DRAFT_263138 [Coniochaeta sp. 2T2.1]
MSKLPPAEDLPPYTPSSFPSPASSSSFPHPPSYTQTLLPTSTPSSSSTPQSLTSVLDPLSTHLRTLPQRIRETSALQHTLQTDTDLELLSYILPHVEAFLLSSDVVTSKAGLAQLVLMPKDTVEGGWGLSEVEEQRGRGEIVRVGRVDVAGIGEAETGLGEKGGGARGEKGEKKSGGGVEGGKGREEKVDTTFDGWGRWGSDATTSTTTSKAYWFRDEAMARRLAAYLQPKEVVKTERREIQKEVQTQKEKKGLFGGWGRKGGASDAKPAPAGTNAKGAAVGPKLEMEGVTMTVRAQEVTFRRENEFGVWESLSGFGVVVSVRVRRR